MSAAKTFKLRAHNAQRRALKHGQLCFCCTSEQFAAVYASAGPGLEVDHITPLSVGALLGLTGLHCVSNLQVLTKDAHKRKTREDKRLLARLKRAHRAANPPVPRRALWIPVGRQTVDVQLGGAV